MIAPYAESNTPNATSKYHQGGQYDPLVGQLVRRIDMVMPGSRERQEKLRVGGAGVDVLQGVGGPGRDRRLS